jgi:hypothetical protein
VHRSPNLPRHLAWGRLLLVFGMVAGVTVACGGGHASRGGSASPTSGPSSSGSVSSGPPPSGISPPAPAGTGRPDWLLEDFDVAPLLDAGLSVPLLQDFFNNPQTFIIVKLGSATDDPRLPDATYVLSFASYRQMQKAFDARSIPSNIKYILYDNEKWAATPIPEQDQPIRYAGQAEKLAHQHGLGLIFTPAANLSTVLDTTYDNDTKYTGFISLKIPAEAAPVCDLLEIQAQQAEGLSYFNNFVGEAVSQARAANPRVVVLLGLTTKAPAQNVTSELLLRDYDTTRTLVAGYWINIPGGTPAGPQDPQVAVGFLEALARQFGYTS